MKISFGCDHAGYLMKKEIIKHIESLGHEAVDFGTYTEEDSVDYPDYAKKAALAVVNGECEKGILICGTGQGIGMSANKIKGIRCAILSDVYSAHMAAEHNDANMISLGARVIGINLAKYIVSTFLSASFEKRHINRIKKMMDLEKL